MKAICGLDCGEQCSLKGNACAGCAESGGHPCGGDCVAAECITKNGHEAFAKLKEDIISEVNSLGIKDLRIDGLNMLNGFYVNLEYTLENGQKVKLLRDDKVYFGNQVERPGNERCYGLVADESYILICEYGCNGADPEIIVYKKR